MALAPIGFAFGGGGWLTLWYLGVVQGLIASGALQPGITPVTGVSAGSQAAAAACAGADVAKAARGAALAAAAACAAETDYDAVPCRWEMDALVRQSLNASMPRGAHLNCQATLAIGVTRAAARPSLKDGRVRYRVRGTYVASGFASDAELFDAVSASSYLPCISGPAPFGSFRGTPSIAGGYSIKRNYICPRNVKRCVTVHSAPRGPLFAKTASAAATSMGAAAPPGTTRAVAGCELAKWYTPLVYFPSDPDKIKIDIYPGKYNPVRMTWDQWQELVLKRPTMEGLSYAYDLGVLDGAAWAAANTDVWQTA